MARRVRREAKLNTAPQPDAAMRVDDELRLLTVVIPARDEEGCIRSTVEHLDLELRLNRVPHEIIVVDDGSTDRTMQILAETAAAIPALRPLANHGQHGFGRAIILGLE